MAAAGGIITMQKNGSDTDYAQVEVVSTLDTFHPFQDTQNTQSHLWHSVYLNWICELCVALTFAKYFYMYAFI